LYKALGPLSTDFSIVHNGEYCWRAQLSNHAICFAPDALIYYWEKSSRVVWFRQERNWGSDAGKLKLLVENPAAIRQTGVSEPNSLCTIR